MRSVTRDAVEAILDGAPWSAGGFHSMVANPDNAIGGMSKQEQAKLLSDFLDGKGVGSRTELAHILAHNYVLKRPEWMTNMLQQFAGWSGEDAFKEANRYLNSSEGKTLSKMLRENGVRF